MSVLQFSVLEQSFKDFHPVSKKLRPETSIRFCGQSPAQAESTAGIALNTTNSHIQQNKQ